jgi:AcrR family transcriptional regulator
MMNVSYHQKTGGKYVAAESMTAGRANQKLRTRNAIVQAAAELSRTGREVTMPEVARAALVSEATAYRYFPDLASLLREAIAGQLPGPDEALAPVAGSDDPVVRVAAVTEFLLRHVLSRQGVVRALIAATITKPDDAASRPGLRFGLIDGALAPLDGTAALAQLKRDLAVVVSAEALFALTDLHGLDPEEAISSIVHTATALTRFALRGCLLTWTNSRGPLMTTRSRISAGTSRITCARRSASMRIAGNASRPVSAAGARPCSPPSSAASGPLDRVRGS